MAIRLLAGLVVVTLVVILCLIKSSERFDRRCDGLGVLLLTLVSDPLRNQPLCIVVIENYGAVLIADVGSLSIDLRGVVEAEEGVHDLVVTDLGGVECDLNDFGMSRVAVADLFVGGVFDGAAGVAADGIDNPRDFMSEDVLDAPEASGAKGREFCLHGGFLRDG